MPAPGRQRKFSPVADCNALLCDELRGRSQPPIRTWSMRSESSATMGANAGAMPGNPRQRHVPAGTGAGHGISQAIRTLPLRRLPQLAWRCQGDGAGDGNRTHVSSLGSCSSTIELHPHGFRDIKESRWLLAILLRGWSRSDGWGAGRPDPRAQGILLRALAALRKMLHQCRGEQYASRAS